MSVNMFFWSLCSIYLLMFIPLPKINFPISTKRLGLGLYKNLKRVLLYVGRIKRLERMVFLSETNRNKCFEIYLVSDLVFHLLINTVWPAVPSLGSPT